MMRLTAAVSALGLSLVLLTGVGLQGQEKSEPEKKETPAKPKRALPTYWKQLNLTPTQKEKTYVVLTEYRSKIEALETQLKKLRADEAADLAKILTDDQRDQLRKIIEQKVGGTGTTPEKKTEPKKTEPTKD